MIPLVIEKEKMEEAKKVAGSEPLLKLLPYKNKKAGIVTTGNEVFYGRIEDKFGPGHPGKASGIWCGSSGTEDYRGQSG